MTVTIPDERIKNVPLTERDALVDVTIGLYKRQLISIGKAAEIAGMPTPELLRELGNRRIPINYGPDDLNQDLEAIRKIS